MEWLPLRAEVVAATARVAEVLRGLPGDAPLARVSWSSAETGAHLVSLARRYRRMARGPRPLPPSLAEDNQRELAEVSERDPRALADLLVAEVAELLDTLGDDGDQRAWYFSAPHTAAGIGAILLTELLMHGLDLARAGHRPWPIGRAQAAACLQGVLPMLTLLVNEKAVNAAGTYHLHLRGCQHWTIRIQDGAATVQPGKPQRADLHFSANPSTFLLSSYGHIGRTRAILSGGIIAWGRRPWLAARFGEAFTET